jgi:hypothetical protein
LPYTNVSLKRGTHCQHLHENRDLAQKCLLEHQAECRKNGKVSDRVILEVESLEDVSDLEIL